MGNGGEGREKKRRYTKLKMNIRGKGMVDEDHGQILPRNQSKSLQNGYEIPLWLSFTILWQAPHGKHATIHNKKQGVEEEGRRE